MKTYVEEFIDETEFSELDLEHPFYNEEEENGNDIKYSNKVQWQDTVSIKIDTVINHLNSIKKKGADRVYIVAHSDHYGYIFTGVNLKELK
jgi:hypothetical protein